MSLELILNELSTMHPRSNIDMARAVLSKMIQVIRKSSRHGVRKILRTPYGLKKIIIAEGYSIGAWFDDNAVSSEEKIYLKSITATTPVLSGVDASVVEGLELVEYSYNGQKAEGLGYAFSLDTLSISIDDLSGNWDNSLIRLNEYRLNEQGQASTQDVYVKNLMKCLHVETLRTWIEQRVREDAIMERNLWDKRNEYFPNLLFCSCVEYQLVALQPGDPAKRQVYFSLKELDNYVMDWNEGNFNAEDLAKTTPESATREKLYASQLTFTCPNGSARLFSWHRRFTPGCGRIHFFPDEAERQIIIGYIGPKIGV